MLLPTLYWPQSYYEARYGAEAWAALDKIPKEQWMEYLVWYRQVRDGFNCTAFGVLLIVLPFAHFPLCAGEAPLACRLSGCSWSHHAPVLLCCTGSPLALAA